MFGCAPAILSGLIEARGLGMTAAAPLAFVEILLVADLAAASEGLDRIPEPEFTEVAGVRVRRIDLFAGEPSAVVKLGLALQAATLGAAEEPAYQARRTDEAEAPNRRGGLS